jgi:hypothetical protein
MLDATVDQNGSVRVVPGSTARFTVSIERGQWVTITSRDTRMIVLNGEGVTRDGRSVCHLRPGKRFRFALAEMAER